MKLARESWRQSLALIPALPVLVLPGQTLVKLMLLWNVFAAVYLTLTWAVFRKQSPSQLLRFARASRPGRWERLLLGGPQHLAQAAALSAFVIAGLALPQADRFGSTALVIAAGIVAIVTSWFTLHIGFAMHYLSLYSETGGLDFPGDEKPAFADLTYFAFAVGTSFGTTDVTITKLNLRKAVQVHGMLSFFFNTMILALTIAVLTSYATSR